MKQDKKDVPHKLGTEFATTLVTLSYNFMALSRDKWNGTFVLVRPWIKMCGVVVSCDTFLISVSSKVYVTASVV